MKIEIEAHEVTSLIREEIAGKAKDINFEEYGIVLQVGDGIARIYGLEKIGFYELIEFESGVKGVAFALEEDNVGCIVLGDTSQIKEGTIAKRLHRTLSIMVGEGMLGRIINPLGEPIDGGGSIPGPLYEMPLERKAPGVIFRRPVYQPLYTGIMAIDAMIPIGRGQRELIIGDRQTGKTSIVIDTIINQKQFWNTPDRVYCIYVACGQKASTIAATVETLRKYGAMEYTIVVAAPASYPASLIYLAPMAGCAIGEFFRDTGRHALVCYDDLSKQAVAYREISLLLRMPPGREAYPGDIFYLHSRLLERAAKIIENDEIARQMNNIPPSIKDMVKGGGSLTALPIIETQAGDVTAYIPTNVISITDGQIYLESSLFNAGIRPAINVGISVSRVGSAAQIKSMKKIAATLKLDQAQFRELETFIKFGAEVDPSTRSIIEKGLRNQELLKQGLHEVLPVEKQISLIFIGVNNLLKDVPLEDIKVFKKEYLTYLEINHPDILEKIKNGIIQEEEVKCLTEACKIVLKNYFEKNKKKIQGSET